MRITGYPESFYEMETDTLNTKSTFSKDRRSANLKDLSVNQNEYTK
jgi:hypothetical protein